MATSRTQSRTSTSAAARAATDVPVVGPREPCPCGSGRRYKACHGRSARAAADPFVARPFEGLAGECDLVALREFVPSATAALTLGGEAAGRTATAATLLPMILPGLVRLDGEPMLGLQTQSGTGDPSRDYGSVLEQLLELEPGGTVESVSQPNAGTRLQDLLDPAAPFEVQVHDTFDFWTELLDDTSGLVASSIERANEAISPTARLSGVDAAYWCRVGDRDYLRWVLPQVEDEAVDALARLHAASADQVGDETRLIGAFRASGLLVAVWDLPAGGAADDLEEPAAAFAGRYGEALAVTTALTPAERSARAGLVNRQRTLR